MARMRHTTTTEGAIALTAATAKTILQVVAPANQRLALTAFAVSFDGVTSGAVPVAVEIVRQTDAGTSSAATPLLDGVGAETIQATARKNATVEPTTTDVKRRYYVHPQTGQEFRFSVDEEILVAGGGRLGLRCTAPAGVNVTGHMTVEE